MIFPATAMNPRKSTLAELEALCTACFEGNYKPL